MLNHKVSGPNSLLQHGNVIPYKPKAVQLWEPTSAAPRRDTFVFLWCLQKSPNLHIHGYFPFSVTSWVPPPVRRLLPLKKEKGPGRTRKPLAVSWSQSVRRGDWSKSLTESFPPSPPARVGGRSPPCRQMPRTGGSPWLPWREGPRGAESRGDPPAPGVGWQMLRDPAEQAQPRAGALPCGSTHGTWRCRVPGSLPDR